MTSESLPWAELPTPAAGQVSRKRVDANQAANWFWARTAQGKYQLVLTHSIDGPSRFPRLNGMHIRFSPAADLPGHLNFELDDTSLQQVFARFCVDLVESTRRLQSDTAIVEAAARTAWRWHRLLRTGSEDLSEAEEQGLVGELYLLTRLLPAIGADDAVGSWTGPFGAPKDFEIGVRAIEVKARRTGAHAKVSVSSLDQLDPGAFEALHLCVIEVSKALGAEGETLAELIARVGQNIRDFSESAYQGFRERILEMVGGCELSERRWMVLGATMFEVGVDFPRIHVEVIPAGVSALRYDLELHALGPFVRDFDSVLAQMGGSN